MTKKDKELLLDELKKLCTFSAEVHDINTLSNHYCKAWLEEDVKYIILNLSEDEETEGHTCECTKPSLNYEAEYNRLLEELAKVTEEKLRWRSIADELEAKNCDMRTVIKTLEFIYGRELEL